MSTQLIKPNFCHLYVLSLNLNVMLLRDPGGTNCGTVKISDAGSHITRSTIRNVKRP